MSEGNVEIVRKAWEAWSRADMAALFEFYDPEVEWDVTHSYVPDMGVFHGHDGIRAFFREWRAFFADAASLMRISPRIECGRAAEEGPAPLASRCPSTGSSTGCAMVEPCAWRSIETKSRP